MEGCSGRNNGSILAPAAPSSRCGGRAVKTLLIVALLLTPATTNGQALGSSVSGIVADSSGATLTGAIVVATHLLNGRKQEVRTGATGTYRVIGLLPGEYEITAVREGFAPVSRRVALLVDAEATLNFMLSLEGIKDLVTVAAEAPLVEVTRSEPSSAITKPQVDALPILDRNFLTLAQLLPGSGPVNGTVTRFAITR